MICAITIVIAEHYCPFKVGLFFVKLVEYKFCYLATDIGIPSKHIFIADGLSWVINQSIMKRRYFVPDGIWTHTHGIRALPIELPLPHGLSLGMFTGRNWSWRVYILLLNVDVFVV